MRHTDGEAVVRQRSEWAQLVHRRQNDPFWKTITMIQMAPEAKMGIGRAITFDFFSALFRKAG